MRLLRWLVVPLLVIPIGLLLFSGLGRDPSEIPSPLIGQPVPAFTLTTIDGTSVSSEDLRGRPLVVNFWASWCGPCVEEHAVLLEAQDRYGEAATIVGVLYNDTADGARGFLARYGDGGWATLTDPSGGTAIDFGVTGPPESFFVDATGIVRYKQYGPVTGAVIDAQLAPLMASR
ncbi:MAG: DsbE family thiol:disulfide interchange protein [Chloroflexota bacterium]